MIFGSIAFFIVLGYRLRYLKKQLDQSLLDIDLSEAQTKLMKAELHDSLNDNFDLEQDWSQFQIKFELLDKGF